MARKTTKPDGTLLIEDRPLFLGLVLIGAVLLGVFLVFEAVKGRDIAQGLAGVFVAGVAYAGFRLAVRASRLWLKADGTARLSVRNHRGSTTTDFSAGSLRAGRETDRRDNSETYRMVLLHDTDTGVDRFPFTAYFSGNEAKADDLVATVMDWRDRTTPP